MRATRAYLAGFGTSGSLLAGAALMFVLVSAFVGFQGWPAVAGESAPVSVSVPPVELAAGSPVSRALSAAVSAPARTGVVARPSGTLGRTGFSTHAGRDPRAARSVHPTATPSSSDPHSAPPSTNGGGIAQPPRSTCVSGCANGRGGSPLTPVGTTVSSATSSAGSTVGSAVTTVGHLIKGGKGTGNSVGSGVSNVVSGTTNTVGQVVTTAQNVVGGVTKGLR